MGRESELLIKLFKVAVNLDVAYVQALLTGGQNTYTKEEYNTMNETMAEVAKYLEEKINEN